MSSTVPLASFCRLCLSTTNEKVPVFANGNILEHLLHMIEIQIDPDDEPGAVVCLDCIVTLEGFLQFKEQCHRNDEFVKTISPKLENSASSAKVSEEEDDLDGFFEVEELEEEEYRLELSETEEVLQKTLQQSAKSNENKTTTNSLQKCPVQQRIAGASTSKTQENSPKNPSTAEVQVLAESYPDFFYFEKGSRSIYYTLVFRGERYNSALFSEQYTYWQCIHRRPYQCPAQLWVSNDYNTFQKRYEHTHGQLPEKKGQAFTPREALPEIFQLCKKIILQNKTNAMSFEAKFQQFATGRSEKADDEGGSASSENESISSLAEDDLDKDSEDENQPKKRSLEPEAKPKSQATDKSEPEIQETDEDELEDDTSEEEDLDLDKLEEECKSLNIRIRSKQGPSLDEQLVVADSYPDFFFFEKGPRSKYFTIVYYGERFHSAIFTEYYTYWYCQHRRKYKCTAQLRVTNDYKTFERRYEHNHPDLKVEEGQAFTPMEAMPELFEGCRKAVLMKRARMRKKQLEKHKFLQTLKSSAKQQDPTTKSIEEDDDEVIEVEELIEVKSPPAVDDSDEEAEVMSSADGENKPENQSLEPEAKPKNQATDKSEPERLETGSKKRKPKTHETDEDELEDDTSDEEEDLDLEQMEEKCKRLKIRKRAKQGPSLDEQLVLADSYPDYFFFEKVLGCVHFNLVYYGERFYSAIFTEYYTYWHCPQKRRHKCPALVRVTNDYKTFERRQKHTHPDIPVMEGEAFTPMEALPMIFDNCRNYLLKKRSKLRKRLLEKHKRSSHSADGENKPTWQSLEPEANPKNQATDKIEPERFESDSKQRKPENQEPDEHELEGEISEEEEDLDLDRFEEEPAKLCPSLDKQLVLADSYPDFFFFEKAPRAKYFTMVYHGERFHVPRFTVLYTYWQCRHHQKYKCRAVVRATNDYKTLKRLYEHNHPDIKVKEGHPFTPMEALPDIFEGCRKVVLRKRAKKQKKLLERHKLLQTVAQQNSKTKSTEEVIAAVQDDEEDLYNEYIEELIEN